MNQKSVNRWIWWLDWFYMAGAAVSAYTHTLIKPSPRSITLPGKQNSQCQLVLYSSNFHAFILVLPFCSWTKVCLCCLSHLYMCYVWAVAGSTRGHSGLHKWCPRSLSFGLQGVLMARLGYIRQFHLQFSFCLDSSTFPCDNAYKIPF